MAQVEMPAFITQYALRSGSSELAQSPAALPASGPLFLDFAKLLAVQPLDGALALPGNDQATPPHCWRLRQSSGSDQGSPAHAFPWSLASPKRVPIQPGLGAIRWTDHSRGSGKRICAKAKRDAIILETTLLVP